MSGSSGENTETNVQDLIVSDWDPFLGNAYFKSNIFGMLCFSLLTLGVIGVVNYPLKDANLDSFPTIDYSECPYTVDDCKEKFEWVLMSLVGLRILHSRKFLGLLLLRKKSNEAPINSVEEHSNVTVDEENCNVAQVSTGNTGAVHMEPTCDNNVEITSIAASIPENEAAIEDASSTPIETEVNTPVGEVGMTLHFMNNLKSFLVLCVLGAHTLLCFIGQQWYASVGLYRSKFNYAMNAMLLLGQCFSMSLFFFIAGYFVPRSFHRLRRGDIESTSDGKNIIYRRRRFLDARFTRIGVPLIIFYLGLGPATRAFARHLILWPEPPDEFLAYKPHVGPCWFLFMLLVVSTMYACLQKPHSVNDGDTKVQSTLSRLKPSVPLFLFVGLLTGVIQGLQIAFAPYVPLIPIYVSSFCFYILFFLTGIVAYNNRWIEDWLPNISTRERLLAQVVSSLLVIALFIVLYFDYKEKLQIYLPVNDCGAGVGLMGYLLNGTNDWRRFALSIASVAGVFTTSFNFVLLDFFYRRLNFTNKILTFLSNVSYVVYLIHPLVVVPLSYAWFEVIKEKTGKNSLYFHPTTTFTSSCVGGDDMLWKGWFFVFGLTIAILYPIGGLLRLIPGMI
mmetsp:Transcript_17538/g.27314  ORF Transcript_17538/g.27314 Transcript_17538/m.27314 type:complete len:618 (-) Transcript_17538:199-2052(-)|eukprot:CAMPEP_0196816708 /NCGR_PEP_ID=MMETSP1362-20130617/56808_1 /TAXON_ID=163516 /ORGANISM="Leptocylindrus danicus, Strain CCMP1856" /LENGTH=617 /DNA_ID=CAMNT_0042194147 /DNA_START=83 /DNA_END=1936 /DNA_ORIENTATION=+